MKRTLSITLAVVMALTMMFGGVISANAAEEFPAEPAMQEMEAGANARSNSFPYTSSAKALQLSTSWKTIATSTTGFGGHVRIHCQNSGFPPSKGYVRLLDKNGNVLWTSSEEKAVPSQDSYSYWCGNDVYEIQVRVKQFVGIAWTTWEG